MGLFRRRKDRDQVAAKELPRDVKPLGEVAPEASRKAEKSPRGGVKRVLSGDVLYNPRTARHYPFVLYCCLLILFYMGFVFYGHRAQREEIECRLELQRVRARSLVFSSERIRATRHGVIQEELKRRNIEIKEWPNPPHVIANEE